jgi:hypothetical protein
VHTMSAENVPLAVAKLMSDDSYNNYSYNLSTEWPVLFIFRIIQSSSAQIFSSPIVQVLSST